ncbi:MAG TPA: aldehyde dehydrogenase family protein [Chthonomonadaceae bacterium]|nr:aldehyde dehydrogenase family protein [Chthonomonadaceae bacterium]
MQTESITVINPYTGEAVGSVPRGGAPEIEAAVRAAQEGANRMRALPLHRRAEILATTAQRLRAEVDPLGARIVSETGKTIREARAEVVRAAGIFQLAAEETRRLHGETLPFDALPNGEGHLGYWTREPLGIVGAITPWNVPLALTAHKVAPALGAGNAVIHKPAEQTPLNALRLAELLREAGLPESALQVVTGYGEEAGDALVTHPEVGFLSFTGSREVGMQLPGRAGFKRVALELGGNSPVIVMPGSEEADYADAIVRASFAVAGQLCISIQRVIVHEDIYASVRSALLKRIEALKVGDPMDETTDVGTLIDAHACDRVRDAVDAARQAGAKVLLGGRQLGKAAYAPTLLDDVPANSPLMTEEAFAPLILLIPCSDIRHAIEIANATPYGLNAGIYTPSLHEALQAARDLKFGSVMINETPSFRSDLMPYGGRKQSGLGREGVRFALEEMTELKVVCFRQPLP